MKIACAAIRTESGEIFLGKRHSDCLFLMSRFGIDYRVRTEGFMTMDRLFVDRKEAMAIAIESGLKSKEYAGIDLFSEDLY